MKNVWKKLVSLFLSLTMLAALTTGCGKDNASTGTDSDNSNSANTEDTANTVKPEDCSTFNAEHFSGFRFFLKGRKRELLRSQKCKISRDSG